MLDPAHIAELVERLVDAGFVDELDEEDCTVAVASHFEGLGMLPRDTVRRLAPGSGLRSRKEKLAIIRKYEAFARTTNSPRERHAKIVSLGATPREITRWARRFLGPGALYRGRPTPYYQVIRDYLREHPWSTRKQIRAATGVGSAISASLAWGENKGIIQRRKGAHGLYEFAAA